ncbi:tetratricopeptide repeat protein [Streptomyces cinerochromogenes]|uniref:tetratricopeptide repeat protein n=1 Tax=Streptomyces cinerochromogenes TaxID=66422 RepID=UPI0033B8E09B
MSGRERRSRGELIRQRAQAHFVGRRAQVSLFTENLAKDPLAETDPADFLFHIHGVGGVGKSTLLRQWREVARRAGALTAVVDENDVHGVPQALTELARQLAEEAGPLKGFDRASEQFHREQAATTEPIPTDSAGGDEASLSSRLVAQAALGAVSLIPGAGVATAMTSPEAAAQGLDRLRGSAGTRGRRGRGADVTGLCQAFIAEVDRLSRQHRWVVLFFDTWEQTGRYLDQWLRDMVQDTFGPLPVNVMVVLAGREELSERDWAPLRALGVQDLPLEVFTEAETRALLAARGVTEQGAVEAVLQLSMGLPLLVELLALARPSTAEDIEQGGDAVDAVVERFVQWINDPRQRETVLACALAPQLNRDVFAAAAPQDGQDLWEWLCSQPFVNGRGGFKQYHAVVRASMVRHQRAHSPQGWTMGHLRLADAHAGWRADAERRIPEAERWGDAQWRRHRRAETYHRLCAHPAPGLEGALELTVHAAGQDTAVLREWTDTFDQAARDTADAKLLSWAKRFQNAADGDHPALAALTVLLTHGHLALAAQAWARTYRGWRLFVADRDEEAVTELTRAISIDSRNHCAWAYRGDVHSWNGRTDQAIADLTVALDLKPGYAWALAERGATHRLAGRFDDAVTDLTAALELDPTLARALAQRGEAHQQAGQLDDAVTDLTAALDLDPTLAWALTQRGITHRLAGRLDDAVTDLTAALELDPTNTWALAERGVTHRLADRLDDAVTDLTAALELDPTNTWALAERGVTHQQAGRYDDAVTDLTAALELDPTLTWALTQRGDTHRLAGRYDAAVSDLTAALDLNPRYALALAVRGVTHRQAGRYDDAVTDLTAALELDPTLTWALTERGVTHRQAGRYLPAQEDFERAAIDEGRDLGLRFEKLLLDTVVSGFATCLARWSELLLTPVETQKGDATRFFSLFRVMLLEPRRSVAAATEAFLATSPDYDTVTDLLHYLSELTEGNGELADRARQCRQLIAAHAQRMSDLARLSGRPRA